MREEQAWINSRGLVHKNLHLRVVRVNVTFCGDLRSVEGLRRLIDLLQRSKLGFHDRSTQNGTALTVAKSVPHQIGRCDDILILEVAIGLLIDLF